MSPREAKTLVCSQKPQDLTRSNENHSRETIQDIRHSPAPLNPIRVLVADDSENAVNILGMFLRIEGYEVAVALDGREAIKMAQTYLPKIVILDLGMPKVDGLEAAREIRRIFPSIILIALSGWGGEKDRQRTTDAGFDMHLVKPTKPDDIRRALQLLDGDSANTAR